MATPRRLLAFALLWAAAFVWFPTLPTLFALALWIFFITPKVRWLGREFQNESVP